MLGLQALALSMRQFLLLVCEATGHTDTDSSFLQQAHVIDILYEHLESHHLNASVRKTHVCAASLTHRSIHVPFTSNTYHVSAALFSLTYRSVRILGLLPGFIPSSSRRWPLNLPYHPHSHQHRHHCHWHCPIRPSAYHMPSQRLLHR